MRSVLMTAISIPFAILFYGLFFLIILPSLYLLSLPNTVAERFHRNRMLRTTRCRCGNILGIEASALSKGMTDDGYEEWVKKHPGEHLMDAPDHIYVHDAVCISCGQEYEFQDDYRSVRPVSKNSVLEATLGRNKYVKCPHCEINFSTRYASSWDSDRHVSCQGRIRLVESDKPKHASFEMCNLPTDQLILL